MNLSQKIKQLREEKGFSLGKLAETAKVSKAYLSQLENNVSKQPSAEILFRIASALGTTIADLLDKPVRVYAKDFHQEMPEGLRTLIDKRGKMLDIREEDVKMLINIEYRGKQPETPEEWEHVLQTIRIVVRPK
jgi:transcriptional regulator with XRE-family HTH domain